MIVVGEHSARVIQGRIALHAFAAERKAVVPINGEQYIAQARVAVDAHNSAGKAMSWQEEAERSTIDALTTLGEVATDVLHYMDGRVNPHTIVEAALKLSEESGTWRVETPEGQTSEFPNAVMLLASLTLCARTMLDDSSPSDLLLASLHRWHEEADSIRWLYVSTLRVHLVAVAQGDAIMREVLRKLGSGSHSIVVREANGRQSQVVFHGETLMSPGERYESWQGAFAGTLMDGGQLVARSNTAAGNAVQAWVIEEGRLHPIPSTKLRDALRLVGRGTDALQAGLEFREAFSVEARCEF